MGQDFHPNSEAEIATTVAKSIPIESGDPSPLSFGAVMADQGTQVADSRVPGGTRNNGDAGNLIDITRWLPKYDIANPGLVRAISGFGDQRQPSAVTQVGDRTTQTAAVPGDGGKPKDIYIKPGGDPRRDAQQIQDAIDAAARAGEQVNINVPPGIYRGNIVFPPGARNISLKAQEVNGRRAVFDMTGMPTSDDTQAVFKLQNNQNITIEGFEIKNYKGSSRDNPPVGIMVTGVNKDITLRGNDIHHLGLDAQGQPDRIGSQPIIVFGKGSTEATATRNINITNNHVHDSNLGQHEGITLNGNVDGFQISINRLTNLNNIGIDIVGGETTSSNRALDAARNGLIRGNFVSGIDSDKNPTYPKGDRSAGGIYIDGGRDVRIENNVVENTNRGIEIGSEHAGTSAQNITVSNNWLKRNHLAAITVGAGERNQGSTVNVSLINNIFQANGPDAKTGVVEQYNVSRLFQSGNKFVDPFWIPR